MESETETHLDNQAEDVRKAPNSALLAARLREESLNVAHHRVVGFGIVGGHREDLKYQSISLSLRTSGMR